MKCEIIAVGTEILLGDIVNTNAQFLSQELARLGFSVMHQSVVGDNEERLAQELKTALSRSDIVITSGGLGPTPDDLTKEVTAKVMGVELMQDKESAEKIVNYFKSKNREMPEANYKQAMLPSKADGIILSNDNGTAPGCIFIKGDKIVVNLPGPPRELKPMFTDKLLPFLKKYADSIIISHSVRLYGIGESSMASKVDDLLEKSNPTVAPYAKDGEALLRVTAKGKDEQEAEQLTKPVVDEILNRFGDLVYGIDCESLQERVVALLIEKGKKLGLAES
nr:CinA family nicotinamide mononucleotide deamidase-related protein [Clostridiales bacterium]